MVITTLHQRSTRRPLCRRVVTTALARLCGAAFACLCSAALTPVALAQAFPVPPRASADAEAATSLVRQLMQNGEPARAHRLALELLPVVDFEPELSVLAWSAGLEAPAPPRLPAVATASARPSAWPALFGRASARIVSAWQSLPASPRASVESAFRGAGELPRERQWVLGGVVLLLLLWLPRRLRQRGDLSVALRYPEELRGTFRVRLSRRRPGERSDPMVVRGEVRKGGVSSWDEHHLVSRETLFPRLLSRRYFTVVEGVLEDPESGEVLVDVSESRVIRVRHRRTVRVECDLRPTRCPVDLRILWDEAPPRHAAVRVEALPESPCDADGGQWLRLWLPKGRHTLVVGSGDRVIEQDIELESHQPTALTVDVGLADRVLFRGCPPAVDAYLSGDVDTAARALHRDGQERCARLLLARHGLASGDLEGAAHHFEAAGDARQAAELRARLGELARAAELYLAADDPVRAARLFQDAGDWLRAGEAFERARDFDAAIACYREAGDTSREVDALDRRGDTFAAAEMALDNGWRARGIRLLRHVTPEDPHFADACALLSDALEREGHWDLAAQKLEEHIAAAGPAGAAPDLQWRLAELVEHAGNVERAVSILEELRRREPTYPDIAARLEGLRKKRSSVMSLSDSGRASATDFAPPTMVLSDYRYEILEEVGRGAMGVVFRARDRRLSREVALKRLPESLKNYPQAVQMFVREAQATARLNHRNIVTVYDADQEDDTFFITMELLRGRPLHHVLRERGRLQPSEVARIGLQVAEGLEYAHSHGVIHRDVKTANLFLCEGGLVKVMDFGLAKTLAEVRRVETGIAGTPFYMAPEQVSGADVDHRADLYALGATLCELATGQVPFPDGDVTYHHRHTAPPDPRSRMPDLPEPLARLILDLLEKDPDVRCPSATLVRERLASFVEGGAPDRVS